MAKVTKICVNDNDYIIQGILYDELGENTDGSMTQASITNILYGIRETVKMNNVSEMEDPS